MPRVDRSYIGKGPCQIKPKGDPGGFFPIGNTATLSNSFEEEKKELPDYTSASGGNANVLTSITGFTGGMTVHDYSADNLALFLRGTKVGIAAAAVADEAHTTKGLDGEVIRLNFMRDPAETVTVVLANDTACVEGTDYALENNGIVVLDGGNIDANGIKVSYTKSVAEVMESLTVAGQEYELWFNGVNAAQEGKLVDILYHRVKFSPAQDLNFIGDDFGAMSADFEVLSDASITGAGISKFMKITQML